MIVKANVTTGQITIFRKYKIMGVAICSYATDKGTVSKSGVQTRGKTKDERPSTPEKTETKRSSKKATSA